ncbi:MAG TPA: hypothetical protein EYQ20_05315 [candidate division Zixibacteria bacterium]|nr:hypothetical protein [candidate division Zixibacteria bacterium]
MDDCRILYLFGMALLCTIMGCMPPSSNSNSPLGSQGSSPEKAAYFLQLQQALDHLSEDPDNSNLYMQAGDVAQRLSLWVDARKYYQKAFDLNPKSAEAIYKVGYTWEKSGQLYVVGQGMQIMSGHRDKAIRSYQKTIDLNSNYSDAYYRLTMIALNAEDMDLAYWAGQELSRLEPNSGRAIALIKQVYRKRQELKP